MGAVKTCFEYLPVTLVISLIPSAIDFILGTLIAFGEYRGKKACRIFRVVISFYAKCMPALLSMFLFYYLVFDVIAWMKNALGIPINVRNVKIIYIAIVALAFDGIGMYAETMRGAFDSVGKNQLEAAYSMGLSTFQAFYRIMFPQVIVEAIINLRLNVLGSILFSSMAYTIGVMDIFNGASAYATQFFAYKEAYLASALVYWCVCLIISRLILLLENYSHKKTGLKPA